MEMMNEQSSANVEELISELFGTNSMDADGGYGDFGWS